MALIRAGGSGNHGGGVSSSETVHHFCIPHGNGIWREIRNQILDILHFPCGRRRRSRNIKSQPKKTKQKKVCLRTMPEERWRTPAALHLAAAATSNFRGKRLGGRGQDNQASGINSLVLSTYLHHNSNHQFPIPLTLQLATASWWTWWLSEEGWVVVAQWACTAVDLASGQY
jgi:hypothetical protein